jgi:hypothetical protein
MYPGAQLDLHYSEESTGFPALSVDSGCFVGRPTFQMTRLPWSADRTFLVEPNVHRGGVSARSPG